MKKHKLTYSDYAPFIEDLIERELSERGFSIKAEAVFSEESEPHFDINIDISLVPSIVKRISKETAEKKINSISVKMIDVCSHTSFPLIEKWYYTFIIHDEEKEKKMTFLYSPSSGKLNLIENQ